MTHNVQPDRRAKIFRKATKRISKFKNDHEAYYYAVCALEAAERRKQVATDQADSADEAGGGGSPNKSFFIVSDRAPRPSA